MAATESPAAPRVQAAGPPVRSAPRPAGAWPATAVLVSLLACCAYAAFAHGAIALGDEAWLQVALALVALAAVALALVPRAAPAAWAAVPLLAAFAVWCGLSIAWSVTPDLSWQETNRAVAYALVVLLGLAVGTRAP